MSTRSSVLIGNVGMNLLGQIWLIAVFMLATPVIIHGLGTAAFGTLSIVWTLMGYFGFLDLGTSAASTKFVAEHLGRNERQEVSQIVFSSVSFNFSLGVLGGIVIAALTPVFIAKVFVVPQSLQSDARFALYVLAASFPFVLAQATLQGAVSAFQRFDVINMINTAAGTLQGFVGMFLVLSGYGLKEVVLTYQGARILAVVAYAVFLIRVIPAIQFGPFWRHPSFHRLMSFGGWVTVSSLVFPLLFSSNQVLIGSWMTIAAVTYYAVPWGIVSRMGIIPRSVASVLYPEFGQRGASADRSEFNHLFVRSVILLFFTMLPAVLLLCVFPREILGIWVGSDFAAKSATTLRLLTVGTFANALAGIAGAAVRSLGRPDLGAKFDSIELALFFGLNWFLIPHYGVSGAALAWTSCMVLDLAMLFFVIWKLTGGKIQQSLTPSATSRGMVSAALIACGFMLIRQVSRSLWIVGAGATGILAVYGLACWRFVLDERDRAAFAAIARGLRK